MRKLTWIIVFIILSIKLSGQTFKEAKDPLINWNNVESGLNISYVSTDKKYAKHEVPFVKDRTEEELTGWKGEKLSAQLLIWTIAETKQVKVEFDNFVSDSNTLPSSIAKSRFVRYVITDEFGPGCGYRKAEDFPASLTADMLDNIETFDVSAKTVRPVWITIDIAIGHTISTYGNILLR